MVNITGNCTVEPRVSVELLFTQLGIAACGVVGNAFVFVSLLRFYKPMMFRMTEPLTLFGVCALLLVDMLWCFNTMINCAFTYQGYFKWRNPIPFLIFITWVIAELLQVSSNFINACITFARYIAICHPLKVNSFLRVKVLLITVSTASVGNCLSAVGTHSIMYERETCVADGHVVQNMIERSDVYSKPKGQLTALTIQHIVFHTVPAVAIVVFSILSYRHIKKIQLTIRVEESNAGIHQFILLNTILVLKYVFVNHLPTLAANVIWYYHVLANWDRAQYNVWVESIWTILSIHFMSTFIVILCSWTYLRQHIVVCVQNNVLHRDSLQPLTTVATAGAGQVTSITADERVEN